MDSMNDFFNDKELTLQERIALSEPNVGDDVVVIGKLIHKNENHYVVKLIDGPAGDDSTVIVPRGQIVKLIDQTRFNLRLKQITDNPVTNGKKVLLRKMVTAILVQELDTFKQPTNKIWLHDLAIKDVLLDEEDVNKEELNG